MRLTTVIFVLCFALRASAQIDLTPTSSERLLEGIKFPQIFFREGVRKISYESPRGWTDSSEGASKIRFSSSKYVQAESSIEVVKLKEPIAIPADAAKLRELVLTLAPKDAEKVKLLEELANPFKI